MGSSPDAAAASAQHGERVVLLLGVAALIGRRRHGHRWIAVRILDEAGPWCRCAVHARVEDAVEPKLQLRGDFGEEVSAKRDEAVVAATAHGDAPSAERTGVVGFGAVLVEVSRPHLRQGAQLIRRGRRCGIHPLATGSRGKLSVGGEHLGATGLTAGTRR